MKIAGFELEGFAGRRECEAREKRFKFNEPKLLPAGCLPSRCPQLRRMPTLESANCNVEPGVNIIHQRCFLGELAVGRPDSLERRYLTANVGFDEVSSTQVGLNAKHWNWQGYPALPNPRRIFQVVCD